jgi:hypothetical protein
MFRPITVVESCILETKTDELRYVTLNHSIVDNERPWLSKINLRASLPIVPSGLCFVPPRSIRKAKFTSLVWKSCNKATLILPLRSLLLQEPTRNLGVSQRRRLRPPLAGSVLPSFAASTTPFVRHRRRRLHPVTDQIQAREDRTCLRGPRTLEY